MELVADPQPGEQSSTSPKPRRECLLCRGEAHPDARICCHCGKYLTLWERVLHDHLVHIIAAIVVGWLLALFSFNLGRQAEYKARLEERARYDNQLIRALKNELSKNWANINNVRELLTKDLEALDKDMVTIVPLMSFRLSAWEQANFGHSDFLTRIPTADYTKLSNCYSILAILEGKIRDREQYRLLREGQARFTSRMKLLDENILEVLDQAQAVLGQAQDFLYRVHEEKVMGPSFYTDRGLVVEVPEESQAASGELSGVEANPAD